MKKYSKEEIINLCEQCCKIMYEATLNGDYKANNKAGEELIEVFKYFENNREFAMDCIDELIKKESVVLKIKMAAFCLALGENISEAEKILYEISNKEENGIFAFNAKMTLKVWKEDGYLRLYKDEDKNKTKKFECIYTLDLERYNEYIKGYMATSTKNDVSRFFISMWLNIQIIPNIIINRKINSGYKRLVSQNNGVPVTNKVTIDETGIHSTNINTNHKKDYLFEQILSITETKNLLILKMEHPLALILDKNNLKGGSKEEVIEFLFEKCKNIKKKKVYNARIRNLKDSTFNNEKSFANEEEKTGKDYRNAKENEVELTDEQKKWNKMWELWEKGQIDTPYAELMTYQSEINNGGHDQYFFNIGNTGNLQKEMSALETILSEKLKNNLKEAYKAYLLLEKQEDDETAEEIIEQCDDVFYKNEVEINSTLKEYKKISENHQDSKTNKVELNDVKKKLHNMNDNILSRKFKERYNASSEEVRRKIDMIDNGTDASQYQLKVIKRKRIYPEINDVFILNPYDNIYLVGGVLNNHINNINGEDLIVIAISEKIYSSSEIKEDEINFDNLLIAPLIVGKEYWTRGYFFNIDYKIDLKDKFDYSFYSIFRRVYMDEYQNIVKGNSKYIRSFGVSTITGVGHKVLKELIFRGII